MRNLTAVATNWEIMKENTTWIKNLNYGSMSVWQAGVYISTTGPAFTDVQYGHYMFDWNRRSYKSGNNEGKHNMNLKICPKMHNHGFYNFDWNKHMKMVYRNKELTITIGHWNGGSSHLGRSVRGLHKLEQIKFILGKYKVDVMGISEANLLYDLDYATIG